MIIVLGLLCNALGTPSAPPNQVLLFSTVFDLFVMSPVAESSVCEAQPLAKTKLASRPL
ncbi:hypothetical protein J4731_22060 [Providencia rettgeri]|nr:hypothetical protein [Providencia rettgeri]